MRGATIPRIVGLQDKKLVGLHLTMNLQQNRTGELWGTFMPRRLEIEKPVSQNFYSVQRYPVNYYQPFSPQNEFEKWATLEVSNFDSVPEGMDTLLILGGQYAVFDYKGLSSDPAIFQYIFTEWLPQSAYQLDDRPHFEVLGDKYKNNDPDSEEEIWIPIAQN